MRDQDKPLIMWTVYNHPSDYPDACVARRFEVRCDGAWATAEMIVTDELWKIRQEMQRRGLRCFPRFVADEPQIVEVWL